MDGKILLDYGLRPSEPLGVPLGNFSPQAAVISHAHLDHSGMVPSLMDLAPSVYMTPVTLDIASFLARDTIKIGKEQGFSFFDEDDLRKLVQYAHTVGYNNRFTLQLDGYDDEGRYECELYDAGHIPGSSMVYLRNETDDINLFYTGDIKMEGTHLLKSASTDFPHADVLFIESTYYGREHTNRKEMEREFVDSIQETLDSGGSAIVPCFAVGRTQEIVMVLHSHGLTPYVYVDGMGLGVLRLMQKHPEYLKNAAGLKDAFDAVRWVNNSKTRRKVISEPSVVVTTAGMLNGGPVLYYLGRIHDDPKSKVLLTGYQIEGTNGRKLLNEGCVQGDNGTIKVDAKVGQYDFSAHAGDSDLKKVVSRFCRNGTEVVFTVHGDSANTNEFAAWIRENLDCRGIAPKNGEEFVIE